MPRKRQIQEQGWTLAELLIVLAILGIMSMLAGPSYHTLVARAQARSATAEIASELRLARQLAMARRERLRVIFDREDRTITLRRADAEVLQKLVVEALEALSDVSMNESNEDA